MSVVKRVVGKSEVAAFRMGVLKARVECKERLEKVRKKAWKVGYKAGFTDAEDELLEEGKK